MNKLNVIERTNIAYDRIVEQAQAALPALLAPGDFVIDPMNYLLDVPDDAFENPEAISTEALFDAPALIKFIAGIRFEKPEPIAYTPVKGMGQFTASQVEAPNKIQVFVGTSMRPYGSIEKTNGMYRFQSSIRDVPAKLFPQYSDLEREIIKLSQLHRASERYFPGRETFIKEVLPTLF